MTKRTSNGPQNTTQKAKYGENPIPFNAKTGSARSMPKPEVHVQCQKPEAYVQ